MPAPPKPHRGRSEGEMRAGRKPGSSNPSQHPSPSKRSRAAHIHRVGPSVASPSLTGDRAALSSRTTRSRPSTRYPPSLRSGRGRFRHADSSPATGVEPGVSRRAFTDPPRNSARPGRSEVRSGHLNGHQGVCHTDVDRWRTHSPQSTERPRPRHQHPGSKRLYGQVASHPHGAGIPCPPRARGDSQGESWRPGAVKGTAHAAPGPPAVRRSGPWLP